MHVDIARNIQGMAPNTPAIVAMVVTVNPRSKGDLNVHMANS